MQTAISGSITGKISLWLISQKHLAAMQPVLKGPVFYLEEQQMVGTMGRCKRKLYPYIHCEIPQLLCSDQKGSQKTAEETVRLQLPDFTNNNRTAL